MKTLARLANSAPPLLLTIAALVVVAAGVLGSSAFAVLTSDAGSPSGTQSAQASQVAKRAVGNGSNLLFLVEPKQGDATIGHAEQVARRVTAGVRSDASVGRVSSYTEPGREQTGLVATDHRSGLIAVQVKGDDPDAVATRLIDRYAHESGDVTVRPGGPLGFTHDVVPQIGKSLALAESLSVPIVLLLLLVVFRSLVAALIPLLIGGIAVVGTFAELSIIGRITDVSVYSINMTTALGLGLGVDYALLIISRFRESLAEHDDVEAAIEETVTTSGRTVLFSAGTVTVALAALLVFPVPLLRSFAYAGVGVVAIAAATAVLVCPALLRLLGHRIDAGRMPWARHRPLVPDPEKSRWGAVADRVMRHPVLAALPVLLVLGALSAPLFSANFTSPDDRVLRSSTDSRHVGNVLRAEYPDASAGAITLVTDGGNRAALTGLADEAARLPHVAAVQPMGQGDDVTVWSVTPTGDPAGTQAQGVVHALRDLPAPAGSTKLVGGTTAELIDTNSAISGRMLLALALVALTTLVILFRFTRSLLQPLRALVSSALSITATLGLLDLIFEHGFGASLISVTPRPLDVSMTVLMACIAFGLSIDYEVFVTGRMLELHEAGADTRTSVRMGLAHTGRLLTAAAVLLAVSFLGFVTASVSFLQFFGLAAGIAVLVDAFLVRAILVPAFMALVGERAWWPGRRTAPVTPADRPLVEVG